MNFAILRTGTVISLSSLAHGELVSTDAHKSARVFKGLKMEQFADSNHLQNATTLCLDEKNRVYIGETHRWRRQVQEIRQAGPGGKFIAERVSDDIACMTTADRIKMHKKWSGKSTEFLKWDEFTADAEKIRLIEDTDGDGKADKSTYFREDFNEPLAGPSGGLIARDGTVYFAMIPGVYALKDMNGDGKAEEVKTLVDGFGCRISFSGHDMNGFAWGPDGKLYWSIGDRGYHVEQNGKVTSRPDSGAVFRCNPDGSDFEEFHANLRNPKEIIFDEFGNLFSVDNNYDRGDKARIVYIMEHGDSGWKMGHQTIASFGTHVFPNMRDTGGDDTQRLDRWMNEGLWQTQHDRQPAYLLPPIAHLTNGPCGLTYNPGVTSFPKSFDRNFFIANYRGSAAKSQIENFTLKHAGAGFALDKADILVASLATTDLDWGYDGKLYISDFVGGWLKTGKGNVFTLFDQGQLSDPKVKEVKDLFANGLPSLSPSRLGELLGHSDQRVRTKAQFALAEKNISEALPLFKAATNSGQPLLKRIHGIWGLGQLADSNPEALSTIAALLQDPEMEVRANAARTLGNHPAKIAAYRPALETLLKDSSSRVISLAAIALANHGDAKSIPAVITLIESNSGKDVYLRHSAIMVLAKAAKAADLAALKTHPSKHVRRAAVVGLRRQRAQEIQAYFDDPDTDVRQEAIRGAYDQHIRAAFPALADRALTISKRVTNEVKWHPFSARRAIHAAWTLARPQDIKTITAIACDPNIDYRARRDALITLLDWNSPPPADPVTAFAWGLPSGRTKITANIMEQLRPIFDAAPKDNRANRLLPWALKLVRQEKLTISAEKLSSYLHARNITTRARLEAFRQLSDMESDQPKWKKTLVGLFTDKSTEIRSQAREFLLSVDPDSALELLKDTLLSDQTTLVEKQLTFKTLGQSKNPIAAEAIISALQKLTDNRLDSGIALDALQAAEASTLPAVKTALQAFRDSLPKEDPLAEWKIACRLGGNIEAGRKLFFSHGAAQCQRCHAINGSGGNVGPELGAIGKNHDSNYLVRSLLTPGSEVAAGYGIGTITLKDGTAVSGFIMADDKDGNAVIKVGEELKTVSKAQIASQTPPISSMPPMAGILKKDEVRDIVAYLLSCTKDKTDDEHK